MSNHALRIVGLLVIFVNMCLVVFNVIEGTWWYTPVNVAAMGIVVWSLHRRNPA